jgi:hypothetical protein
MRRHSRRKGNLLNLLREIGPIKLAARDQPGWTDRRADAALRPARKKRLCRIESRYW